MSDLQFNPYEFTDDQPEILDRRPKLDPMTLLGILSAIIPVGSIGGLLGYTALGQFMPRSFLGVDGGTLAFGVSAVVATVFVVWLLTGVVQRWRIW